MTPRPRMPALLVERLGPHCVSLAARAAPLEIVFLGVAYVLTPERTKGGWPVYQERLS